MAIIIKIVNYIINNQESFIISVIFLIIGYIISRVFSDYGKLPFFSIVTDVTDDSSFSEVVFGNRGSMPIKKDDIAKTSPIIITIENGEIIGEPIIKRVDELNKFELHLSVDNKSIEINFDYIDTNESIIINIYHTKQSKVKLKGIVIGYGNPKKYIFPSLNYTIFYGFMFYIATFLSLISIQYCIWGKTRFADLLIYISLSFIFIIGCIYFFRLFHFGIIRPKGFVGFHPRPHSDKVKNLQ